jgi:hypothetical protein
MAGDHLAAVDVMHEDPAARSRWQLDRIAPVGGRGLGRGDRDHGAIALDARQHADRGSRDGPLEIVDQAAGEHRAAVGSDHSQLAAAEAGIQQGARCTGGWAYVVHPHATAEAAAVGAAAEREVLGARGDDVRSGDEGGVRGQDRSGLGGRARTWGKPGGGPSAQITVAQRTREGDAVGLDRDSAHAAAPIGGGKRKRTNAANHLVIEKRAEHRVHGGCRSVGDPQEHAPDVGAGTVLRGAPAAAGPGAAQLRHQP